MTNSTAKLSTTERSASSANPDGRSPRWIIALVMLPCLASGYFATVESSLPELTITAPRPSLHFATYMYHHGDQPVEPTATLTSEFRFRNRGTQPVKIDQIERSCGCMSPQLTKTTIAPGEVASLIVPVQTVNQSPGFHEYMLTVHYSDPEPQLTSLVIKATFPEKMLVVQPKALFLSQRSDRPLPFEVAIDDFRDSPLQIQNVEATADFVTAALRQPSASGIVQTSYSDDAPAAGVKATIVGSVQANVPPGRHHVLIAASTNDPEFPVVTVPMMINGPAYPPGKEASLKTSHVRLVASENPSAQIESSVLLEAPTSWKISHATAWPEELEVRHQQTGVTDNGKQITRISIKLAQLPENRTKDGIVQLIANDGKDLVTVKVSFIWP